MGTEGTRGRRERERGERERKTKENKGKEDGVEEMKGRGEKRKKKAAEG